MARLDGKVAVITGGNSGIGLATAHTFVDEGAKVVLFGRNQETLDEAVAGLGDAAIGVQGDVSNLADLDRLYDTAREAFGRVDILFVNAGIAPMAPLTEVDEALFDKVFDVNVKGAFFTVQKALPLLQEGASVILTTSVANQMGMPGMSVYAASKAAARSLARTLSAELLENGIRVNTISPGPIETPIFGRLGLGQEQMDEMATMILDQVPMKRMGSSDEIANAVLFLGSSDASYVLGTELVVDGGMSQL